MDAKSTWFETAILNWALRGEAAPTLANDLTIGLFTTEVDEDGQGTEVDAASYERATVTRNTTNFSAPAANGAGMRVSNAVEISFPTPLESWGTVTHGAVFSGANLLYTGPLPNPRPIGANDPAPKFEVNGLGFRER